MAACRVRRGGARRGARYCPKGHRPAPPRPICCCASREPTNLASDCLVRSPRFDVGRTLPKNVPDPPAKLTAVPRCRSPRSAALAQSAATEIESSSLGERSERALPCRASRGSSEQVRCGEARGQVPSWARAGWCAARPRGDRRLPGVQRGVSNSVRREGFEGRLIRGRSARSSPHSTSSPSSPDPTV